MIWYLDKMNVVKYIIKVPNKNDNKRRKYYVRYELL